MCNLCKKESKCNLFAVIGIAVSVVAAMAGIAYLVYRLVNKNCVDSDDCYEFNCEDCDCDDCSECPVAAEFAQDDIEAVEEAEIPENGDAE